MIVRTFIVLLTLFTIVFPQGLIFLLVTTIAFDLFNLWFKGTTVGNRNKIRFTFMFIIIFIVEVFKRGTLFSKNARMK